MSDRVKGGDDVVRLAESWWTMSDWTEGVVTMSDWLNGGDDVVQLAKGGDDVA